LQSQGLGSRQASGTLALQSFGSLSLIVTRGWPRKRGTPNSSFPSFPALLRRRQPGSAARQIKREIPINQKPRSVLTFANAIK